MTAFTAAVTDYMKAPKIDEIDVEGYTGTIGETIAVRTATPFKFVSVKISIQQRTKNSLHMEEFKNCFC